MAKGQLGGLAKNYENSTVLRVGFNGWIVRRQLLAGQQPVFHGADGAKSVPAALGLVTAERDSSYFGKNLHPVAATLNLILSAAFSDRCPHLSAHGDSDDALHK